MANSNIALARVDVTHAEIGTEVELDGYQNRLLARIVCFAHCDPDKTRPRS